MLAFKMAAIRLAMSMIVFAPLAATASQGPGAGPGTASHATQLAMAILIYGVSALIVGGGLISALRDLRK